MNLWSRLALAISLGFVLLFLAFSLLAEKALQESTTRILEERMVIAQMAARQIDSLIEQTIAGLERAGQFSEYSPETLRAVAEAEQRAYQKTHGNNSASGMIFLNSDGESILIHPPDLFAAGTDLLQQDFIELAYSQQAVTLSEPFYDPQSASHLVRIAVPIHIESRFSGLIIGAMDLDNPSILSMLEEAATLGISGHASLVTSAGLTLASTNQSIPYLSPGEHHTFYRQAMASHSASVEVVPIEYALPGEIQGERHVMAFVPLKMAPWGVAVGGDEAETFAGVQRLRYGMVVLGGVTLAGLWAATLLGARWLLRPVRELTTAAEEIASGNLSMPLHSTQQGEIGILAAALERMRAQLLANIQELTAWNETLEVRVRAKTEDLRQQGTLIRQLLRRSITAQEEERARIARELHDEIGQALTAVDLSMEQLSRTNPSNQLELQERLNRVRALTQQAITDLRRIIAAMRPGILDELGLVPALGWMGDHALRPAGVSVNLDVRLLSRLPGEIETTLFRIAQEAMSNVARHSQAKNLHIHLEQSNGEVVMTMIDDGLGLEPGKSVFADDRGRGLGLAGMKERASLLGGEVSIASAPGQGTTLRVAIPL